MSYKLEYSYTEEERLEFIVEYNHNKGLRIETVENIVDVEYEGEVESYILKENHPTYFALEANEILVDGEVIIDPDYEEKEVEKEQQRIQELSMTKSDFFDGMIRAFGLDQDDLQPVIEAILSQLQINEIDKKVAMNNYKNAKDFYRKHTLFALLSDREIPISETQSIKISSTQWDRFFDETNKKNEEAYKELIGE